MFELLRGRITCGLVFKDRSRDLEDEQKNTIKDDRGTPNYFT